MNRRERRRRQRESGRHPTQVGGFAIRGLVWDGEAPWWCSWCGAEMDDDNQRQAGLVRCGSFHRTATGEPLDGLYECKFLDRAQVGLMVAMPRSPIPHPVLVTCGVTFAKAMSGYLRDSATMGVN